MGWGAHLLLHQTHGVWSAIPRHINLLEFQAVFLAQQAFLLHVQNQHLISMMDNTTVVAYINKQGGHCHPRHQAVLGTAGVATTRP